MAATTHSAREVARLVAKATGKPCDAKRVRAWARANVTRFDDDGYTAHAYTTPEATRIVAALVARAKGQGTGTNARSASAAQGRASKPAKPASKPASKPNARNAAHEASKPATDAPSA